MIYIFNTKSAAIIILIAAAYPSRRSRISEPRWQISFLFLFYLFFALMSLSMFKQHIPAVFLPS